MISTATSIAMHLFISSFQGIRAVGQVLGYVWPRNMSSIKAKINVNTKHLTKGDPLPPFNGKLRLYNMRFCPYAERAVLALNAKNIDYEVINIDLVDKPEWLVTKSAFTKVPALEVAEGVSIYESLVIVDYLEDVYADRPLLPKDPIKKAMDKIIIEAMAPIQSLIFKLIKAPETINEDVIDRHFNALAFIQSELQKRGTKFMDGDQPGYADYMIWPWFERLVIFNDNWIKPDSQKYKIFLDYVANMSKDPVVKGYEVPKEVFEEFNSTFGAGKKPNYDLLLEE